MHSTHIQVITIVFIFSLLQLIMPANSGTAADHHDFGLKSSQLVNNIPGYKYIKQQESPQLSIIAAPAPQPINSQINTNDLQFDPLATPVPALISSSIASQSSNPQTALYSLLPLVFHTVYVPPSPPETVLFCDNIGGSIPIPDGDPNGINNDIVVTDSRYLVNLSLYLNITHQAVGNLVVKLSNQDTGEKITAIYEPGNPPSQCSTNNIIAILDDRAAQPVDEQCASAPAAISGIYRGTDSLSEFTRQQVSGTWRLNVSDQIGSNVGSLNHWCLKADVADLLPAPTPPPTPVYFDDSAYVNGMWGIDQQLKLDCESRSAVDWARHYDINIGELDFLSNLPRSDDPETGFVGDPNGTPGKFPPDDYGVHSPPVADLLNDYGLEAESHQYFRWDDLRASITNGNPVITWIISGSSYSLANGIPVLYTPDSTGKPTVVASFEHTVIVVGYSPTSVRILNGSHILDIPIDQFLDSWSVLQFQAVLYPP